MKLLAIDPAAGSTYYLAEVTQTGEYRLTPVSFIDPNTLGGGTSSGSHVVSGGNNVVSQGKNVVPSGSSNNVLSEGNPVTSGGNQVTHG